MYKKLLIFCERRLINMEERFDTLCWEQNKKLLPGNDHNYPGLLNITYQKVTHAHAPVTSHYHSNLIEFHFIFKGMREIKVGDENFLTPGNRVFIVYSNEVHSSVGTFERPVEFYSFQLDLQNRDNIMGLGKEYSNHLYDLLTNCKNRMCVLTKEDMLNVKHSIENLLSSTNNDHYSSLVSLASILFKIPLLPDVTTMSDENINENIAKARLFIDENFKETLTIKEMAAHCGYSQSYFQTHFKNIYGVSPIEYLNDLRIEHAKALLAKDNIDITTIAFELGFSSSNYFSTFFKKYTNTTPTLYRNSQITKQNHR